MRTKAPALLLLEYCEMGSLDKHLLAEKDAESPLSMTVRLSYCVDIASGLGFLASRRVVHRDVAARNVLLDAAFACKVADFGMAVLLPAGTPRRDGGEYQKNYVRLNGERQPVRWAAIEVLTDGRFSTASDVSCGLRSAVELSASP